MVANVIPFVVPWASGAEAVQPSAQVNLNGYQCGPADAKTDNWLEQRIQIVANRFAEQMIKAATTNGLSWDLEDEDGLLKILNTYKDIITEDLVINVPIDYQDPADAMVYLSKFRIANDVQVIINCAANTYNIGSKVITGHPDGLRIKILGASPTGGMPVAANFQVTGSGGAQISTDRVVNRDMLMGKFKAIILSTNGAVDTAADHLTLENLLFLGSGSGSGIKTSGGHIRATNVAAHYYLDGWLVDRGGIIYAPGCTASGCAGNGWNVTNNGTIYAQGSVASGNAEAGFTASIGGTVIADVSTAKGNGGAGSAGYFVSLSGIIQARASSALNNEGSGYLITNDGFIQARESQSQNNKLYGYSVFNGGRLNAAESNSGSNTSGDYRCSNFGAMTITGYGGTASASPTVNTVGNGNCYIKN